MEHPGFFERAGPFPLAEVARAAGAELVPGADGELLISDVKPLADAGRGHVSFLDNRKYLPQLANTRAAACLISPALASRVPAGTAALVTATPYHCFARALQLFYPDALRPKVSRAGSTVPIDPTAQLEEGVLIEPEPSSVPRRKSVAAQSLPLEPSSAIAAPSAETATSAPERPSHTLSSATASFCTPG